jgi:hypothetical protein
MVYAMLSIGFLGFMVWGHHMFMSGMSPYTAFAFSIMTMGIGVPSAIKTFNWLGTLLGGRIRFTSPMLFAIGFVSLFVTGGISGPFLAQPVLDIYLHETYFVIAHFHLIMGVASIFGIFAATYYWFPKMFGRMMNETLGKAHFWLTFVGAYAIFMPMHYYGMAGGLRRYSQGTEVAWIKNLAPIQQFITFDHRQPAYLFVQSFLEHVQGRETQERQSVGGDDARMDHGIAAAARQFWRENAGGAQRRVRIQRAGCAARFCDADGPGGRGQRERQTLIRYGNFHHNCTGKRSFRFGIAGLSNAAAAGAAGIAGSADAGADAVCFIHQRVRGAAGAADAGSADESTGSRLDTGKAPRAADSQHMRAAAEQRGDGTGAATNAARAGSCTKLSGSWR